MPDMPIITETPADVTPASTATPSVEQSLAEMKAQISSLELQLKASAIKNRQESVVDDEGVVKKRFEFDKETQQRLSDMWKNVEENKRYSDDQSRANPVPYATPAGQLEYRASSYTDRSIAPEDADCIKVLGRKRWEEMSMQQRGKVRTTRQSDVDRLDPKMYFGPTSKPAMATALIKDNPILYAALKQRAIREGSY